MRCPVCGCKNAEDNNFCEECGCQLVDANVGANPVASVCLELGTVLQDRWKLVEEVRRDPRCGLFKAVAVDNEEESALILECRIPTAELQQWQLIMEELECPWLWSPWAVGEHEGHFFAVGSYPGNSLRSLDGELNPARAYDIVRQVLLGLETLHGMGWRMCLLSPDYVWCADGNAVIVAVPLEPEAISGESVAVLEGFSSPESYGLEGGEVGERSDVYSAGALLYYMLNRGELHLQRAPWGGPGLAQVEYAPKCPLMAVAAVALNRDPRRRYPSVSDMRLALEEAWFRSEHPQEAAAEARTEGGASTQPLPLLADWKRWQPEEVVPVGSASAEAPVAAPDQSEEEATSDNRASHPTNLLEDADLLPADAPYEVGRISHVGAVRTVNQDALLELRLWTCERDIPTQVHLLGVIDGMGGEAEGDKAASIAVHSIAREVLNSYLPLPGEAAEGEKDLPVAERQALVLKRALQQANSDIFAYASQDPLRRGMGCTATVALVQRGLLTVAHVGDTRAYRCGREMQQISRDHSVVGQLVEMGALTKEQARHSPQRNIIIRALGTAPEVEVDTYQQRLERGEYLFISCDGVWEYYSDEELSHFFADGKEPQEICSALVKRCLELGASDNTTAVIMRYLP